MDIDFVLQPPSLAWWATDTLMKNTYHMDDEDLCAVLSLVENHQLTTLKCLHLKMYFSTHVAANEITPQVVFNINEWLAANELPIKIVRMELNLEADSDPYVHGCGPHGPFIDVREGLFQVVTLKCMVSANFYPLVDVNFNETVGLARYPELSDSGEECATLQLQTAVTYFVFNKIYLPYGEFDFGCGSGLYLWLKNQEAWDYYRTTASCYFDCDVYDSLPEDKVVDGDWCCFVRCQDGLEACLLSFYERYVFGPRKFVIGTFENRKIHGLINYNTYEFSSDKVLL